MTAAAGVVAALSFAALALVGHGQALGQAAGQGGALLVLAPAAVGLTLAFLGAAAVFPARIALLFGVAFAAMAAAVAAVLVQAGGLPALRTAAVPVLACGLLAMPFLRMAVPRAGSGEGADAALDRIKPVFFLTVFVESLYASFLPQLLHGSAEAAGLSGGAASLLFMLYFLCFALVLVPADRAAQLFGPRPVLLGGTALAAAGAFLLASAEGGVTALGAARVLCGLGQGMVLIGVQSYILNVADQRQVTRGASVIVTNFNAGMISGTALGALLAARLPPAAVFILSGLVLLLVLAQIVALVGNPRLPDRERGAGLRATLARMGRDMAVLLRDGAFMRTMLLVGMPAKAVLTGVVSFALPLMLAQRGFAQEDIGQVIVLYAGGIMLASGPVARLVDRTGRTGPVLVLGGVLSGAALLLFATACAMPGGTLPLVGSMLLLGVAHALIYAPVVAHVACIDVAHRVGSSTAAANYRFLERLGHIAGPPVVGQALSLAPDSAAIAGIGVVLLLFAMLFLLRPTLRSPLPRGM